MENVKRFYEALASDKELQEKAAKLNEGIKPEMAEDKAVVSGVIIDFAKANGYDFTLAELEDYQKQPQQIPDEELDAVSGGVFDSNTCYCFIGGGGVDDESGGHTCACVIGGGGRQDKAGDQLVCVGLGFLISRAVVIP